MARTKYGNRTSTVDNISFDSKDEAHYYQYLCKLQKKGVVKMFVLQPKYELIPKFTYFGENRRAVTYTPDFLVEYADGRIEVVDVKSVGTATQQGELRRKLFEYRYNDVKLIWVCRNLKHGNAYGWILYEDLKKIYRENKKNKKGNRK